MEPAVLGGKLASALVAPLVRKLFATGGPGAGLVDRPVRLTDLVSFRGEKRALGDREVRGLAGRLVEAALGSPGEPPFPHDETEAVADALATRLLALGDLDMDDVQAVRLGHGELAARLRRQAAGPGSGNGLSADAGHFLDSATEWACLHILEFDTREYAVDVLDHLDRTGLYLTCETPAQLAALTAMRPWHRLWVRGPHTMSDVLTHVPEPGAVEELVVSGNPGLTDLDALRAFESLRGLSVDQPLPGARLTDSLPTGAPLRWLRLGVGATATTGLRGLSHWTTLERLTLPGLRTTPDDLAELSRLPHLRRLELDAARADDAGRLADLFPHVKITLT